MLRLAYTREAELALLNAPFEADGWTRAIERLGHACGCDGANLVGMGGPLSLSLNLFAGIEASRAGHYFAKPELWGACNWRVNTSGAPLSVQHDGHYAAYRQVADTADYDDAVADLDMVHGCQSVLISEPNSFVGLALFRSRRRGPCDSDVLDSFRAMLRPVQRALRMQLALDGEAAEMLSGDLGAVHRAVFLLDRYGCVADLSPAAEEIAEAGEPVWLNGLDFRLRDRAENRQLQSALARLLVAADSPASWMEMTIGRSEASPKGAWKLRIFRLPSREHGLGFEPHIAVVVERSGEPA